MNKLVNLKNAGSMFDFQLFEGKIQVFEFEYQLINMFEFVRFYKNDVRVCSMFAKMMFDLKIAYRPWQANCNFHTVNCTQC